MSQEVLDEIARISLAISKQIAVATGVPDEKLSSGIQYITICGRFCCLTAESLLCFNRLQLIMLYPLPV